jgi:hypothetical protein
MPAMKPKQHFLYNSYYNKSTRKLARIVIDENNTNLTINTTTLYNYTILKGLKEYTIMFMTRFSVLYCVLG